MKVIKTHIAVFFCCITITSFSQESVHTAGGEANGAGGKVSYSIGQPLYTTDNGSGGSVSKGVQHAYEIIAIGIKEIDLDIKLSVYPNPTTDVLTIEISDYKNESLKFNMYDAAGKLVESGTIASNKTSVITSALASGVYFLNIMSQNKNVLSYKVIKN